MLFIAFWFPQLSGGFKIGISSAVSNAAPQSNPVLANQLIHQRTRCPITLLSNTRCRFRCPSVRGCHWRRCSGCSNAGRRHAEHAGNDGTRRQICASSDCVRSRLGEFRAIQYAPSGSGGPIARAKRDWFSSPTPRAIYAEGWLLDGQVGRPHAFNLYVHNGLGIADAALNYLGPADQRVSDREFGRDQFHNQPRYVSDQQRRPFPRQCNHHPFPDDGAGNGTDAAGPRGNGSSLDERCVALFAEIVKQRTVVNSGTVSSGPIRHDSFNGISFKPVNANLLIDLRGYVAELRFSRHSSLEI